MYQLKIGVLALQGAIEEHLDIVARAAKKLGLDAEVIRVINPSDLEGLDGLVMPGGESTSMTLIGGKNGTLKAVQDLLDRGIPTFGTCAGAILLSKSVKQNERAEEKTGVFPKLDVHILRNGYGRQVDSFSTKIDINGFEKPFEGIFIRAPRFSSINSDIEVLAETRGDPVLIRHGSILAATFHPELTQDTRIHEYFLKMVRDRMESQT